MASLANVLKEEVGTLARRELRRQTADVDKSMVRCERDIAALKREVEALMRELTSLRSPRPAPTVAAKKKGGPASPRGQAASKGSAASASAEPSPRGEFSGEALKAHRERVGLSADNYGKLIGVSGLSIYNWEQGKARPRRSSADAWTAIKRIGKREAAKRLTALETPEAKSDSKQTPAEK